MRGEVIHGMLATVESLTRLPLWRIRGCQVPTESFRSVVNYWPAAEWVTAPCMALTVWLGGLILPYSVAVCLAIAARMLLTGAMHEDGFADYMDGLGGHGKAQVLAIMKDSHTGVYGVLSLVVYVLLLYSTLSSLEPKLIPYLVLAGDPLAKWCASWVATRLPYARADDECKFGVAYRRPTTKALVTATLLGCLPLLWLAQWPLLYLATLGPAATSGLLIGAMRRRLGGYTGDCCGALFVLCELSFYLSARLVLRLWTSI